MPYYATITKPLQDRKTVLLSSAPRAGSKQKTFTTQAGIEDPIPSEETAFRTLQRTLSKPLFLAYFDGKRPLYINLDTSKVFGFGAIIYYIDGELNNEYPKRLQVRLVLFLSRLLKDAETRYWPTELELAGIVWVLRKVRYIIKSVLETIVYTDYRATLGIAKQTSLITTSTARLNLCLVRASEYIQRFRNLYFRYKPGKQYIIPDALLRLHSTIIDTGLLDI